MKKPIERTTRKRLPDPTPFSHLIRIDQLGLHAVSYRDAAVRCALPNGEFRNEWLPRDIIGKDGKSLIIWRPVDDVYSIAGYEPWHDGMFGGRKLSIHSTLNWIERAIDVRAGRAKDFLGC